MRDDEHTKCLTRRVGNGAAERDRHRRGEDRARYAAEMRDDRPEQATNARCGRVHETTREERAIAVGEAGEQSGAGHANLHAKEPRRWRERRTGRRLWKA